MFKKILGIILTLCVLATSCLCGMSIMAAEANHGIYIDTTACTGYSTIVLTQAVHNQPTGNYTVEFDYYTEEFGAKSRLNIRTSGNVGESAADLYSTTFKKDEWLTYSSTIQNQKNTAIMIKLYVWPGFKGYIDNIVLKDSNGAVSLELDFDAKTTTVQEIGQDKNAIAEVKECPEKFDASKNHGLFVDTTACSGYSTIVLSQAVYSQPVGEYTIEFDYYTEEFGAKSMLWVATSGSKDCTAAGNTKAFTVGEWNKYSSTIANENTALQIKFYIWPGFKGYIDNIVLKDSNGAVSLELDFDTKTTTVQKIGQDQNAVAKVKECPDIEGSDSSTGNHGLYIDTTACTSWTTIVLEKAVYEQTAGSYTIDYDYYTEQFGAKSRISIRTSGNVGENMDEVNATKFKNGEWLHQTSVIANQNTAIQLKFYIWPGFKGYVDNIVLKDQNGNTSIALDFEENTTNIASTGGVAGMVAKIAECPANEKETPEITPSNNKGLYIDTTECSNHSTITLTKAIYDQPVGKYTVEFEYYTVEFGAKSRIHIRTSGNVGEDAAELYSTSFKKNEVLKYSSTIDNKNTAIQLKLYVWPGFKGYIDNIVLKKPDGTVAMTIDFDENTTTVDKIGQDTKAVTKIEGRPDAATTGKNHGLYVNTINCSNHASLVLAKAVYDQPVGDYTIEFDYYTLANGAKSRLAASASGNVGEYMGDYSATGFKKNAWLHYTATSTNQNTAIQVKLYMWPGFEGYIDNIVLKKPDGTVAMTIDFDQNNTTILTKGDDSKLNAEIKEAPAYVKDEGGDEVDKEEELVGGPHMLKQENYKFSEKLESVLTYQAFHQHVGVHRNGNEIKPSTKYIFSFDYYCDPGENGTGVNSATAQVKTLHTGHNATFPNANMNMLYDKSTGTYKGMLIENVGRNHFEIEFETLPEQTDIIVGVQSGWDGDAYYWNFKLVEKNGNGENLLERTEFMGTFLQNAEDYNANANHILWKVSGDSADGNGTYSFVEFNEAIANLGIGETLPEEGEEDEEAEGPAINVQDPNEDVDVELDTDNDDDEEKGGLSPLVIVIIVASVILLIGVGVLLFVLFKKPKK